MRRRLALLAIVVAIGSAAAAMVFAVPRLPERAGGIPTAKVTRGSLPLNV